MMTTLVPFLPELDFKQTSVMKETIANTNTEGIDKRPFYTLKKRMGL